MRYWEIFRRIEKEIDPLYIFISEEDFLVDLAIEKIINKLKDFKVITFSNETNLEKIKEEIFSLDFFSQRKLVILKNISSIRKKLIDFLKEYIERKNFKDVLIVVDNNISRNKDWYDIDAVVVIFWKLRKQEAFHFIKDELSKEKFNITYEAFDYLYDIYNGELKSIFSDIEKAKIYLDKGNEIDINLVLLMEGRGKSDIEVFFKSIIKGDSKSAFEKFNQFLQEKEHIMKLFYSLMYKLKRILVMKKYMRDGFNYSDALKKTGGKRRDLWGIEREIEEIEEEKFLIALKKLLKVQEEFLSGRYSDKFVFEKIIIDFCNLFQGVKSF